MNIQKSYAKWCAYRNTVAELNRLSSHELSDLVRGDIHTVARRVTR